MDGQYYNVGDILVDSLGNKIVITDYNPKKNEYDIIYLDSPTMATGKFRV